LSDIKQPTQRPKRQTFTGSSNHENIANLLFTQNHVISTPFTFLFLHSWNTKWDVWEKYPSCSFLKMSKLASTCYL